MLKKYTCYLLYYLGDVGWRIYQKLMGKSVVLQGNDEGPWEKEDIEDD